MLTVEQIEDSLEDAVKRLEKLIYSYTRRMEFSNVVAGTVVTVLAGIIGVPIALGLLFSPTLIALAIWGESAVNWVAPFNFFALIGFALVYGYTKEDPDPITEES